jgi:LPXTG-motif cell wall-anchored protein
MTMSYSTSSLKIALGLAVLENKKLDKGQKISMMEFIKNGTDAQIRHLALTGEVKHKYTIAEKEQLAEKINSVKLSEGIRSTLQELTRDDVMQHGGKVMAGARKLGAQAKEHGEAAMGHVAKGAQKAADFVNQHTGGHGTAAAAIAGGAALAGGAAALLARRRAKKKAEMAKAAAKKK